VAHKIGDAWETRAAIGMYKGNITERPMDFLDLQKRTGPAFEFNEEGVNTEKVFKSLPLWQRYVARAEVPLKAQINNDMGKVGSTFIQVPGNVLFFFLKSAIYIVVHERSPLST
jgi:hypothetical protein